MLTIALAGNPNSGKTTTFNEYTGARQHVANYPGITVDQKDAVIHVNNEPVRIIDLPGTYSITAYSEEEKVVTRAIFSENIDAIINVINSSTIERSLYLAVQFLELGVPLVLCLNMMDEAQKKGISINTEKLSEILNLPVVSTIARTKYNLPELLEKSCATAKARKGKNWQPLHISYGPDLDPVIEKMSARISEEQFLKHYPARWLALKYLENDEDILHEGEKSGSLHKELMAEVEKISDYLTKTLETYPEAVIADFRYGFINGVLKQGVLDRKEDLSRRLALSDQADRILTHRFLGPLLMFAVLYIVYELTFTLGDYPMQWVEAGFSMLRDGVDAVLPDSLMKSLILSGIIDGAGGVAGFVPLIMIIFFLIAALEDSGYMARIAYMLDKIFRLFGLHGNSVMPYIISGGIAGGCAVPGVMATRTLRSPREKLATILTLPFLTCGAKLPVFLLFSGIFFPDSAAVVMFSLTMIGWITALLVARLLRSTVIRGDSTPFVMELPPYRFPTLRGLLIHTWERTWQYLKKAGTIILAISILLWAAMTFPGLPEERSQAFDAQEATITKQMESGETDELKELMAQLEAEKSAETLRSSAAGRLGVALESVSRLAGFDWKTNIALIGGFAAKEVIVSTLGTAYSLGEVDVEETDGLAERIRNDSNWTPATALALMIFVLLYAPCFVTVVMIRRETGSWAWAWFGTVFNTAIAFALAVAIYQFGFIFSG